MPKPPKYHTFDGRKYLITRDELHGYVDHPETNAIKYRELNCSPNIKGFIELETWIHESLHAAFPSKKEADVSQAGHDIARLIWRLGYRKR